jgi:hypothetical protein
VSNPHAAIRRPATALLICGILLFAGCESKPYALVPVAGTVTLDGQPVPGAVVNFQPRATETKSPGPGSTGRCDAEGRFELKTIRKEPGAVVGPHTVRIYSHSPESPAASDTDTGPSKEIIPSRYNYESELTYEVPSGGTSSADFVLTTK